MEIGCQEIFFQKFLLNWNLTISSLCREIFLYKSSMEIFSFQWQMISCDDWFLCSEIFLYKFSMENFLLIGNFFLLMAHDFLWLSVFYVLRYFCINFPWKFSFRWEIFSFSWHMISCDYRFLCPEIFLYKFSMEIFF